MNYDEEEGHMKSRDSNKNKSKVWTVEGGILGTGLYAGVVIVDTSEMKRMRITEACFMNSKS